MFNTFRSPSRPSRENAGARAPWAYRLAAIALSFTLVFGVHVALAERAALILS